jgi:hypothetical protein
VDPVPDPLLLKKSVSAGNGTWIFGRCSSLADSGHGVFFVYVAGVLGIG